MDAKMVNPFIESVINVMPQLGFQNVQRGRLVVQEQILSSKGVTVIIGLTKGLKGNVAYNLSENTAMKIASTMMMGMPVSQMDEMAQSAISEMVNMVTANAAINFEKQGFTVDISPPTLVVGNSFQAKLSNDRFLSLEMEVDAEVLELNIAIES